MRVQASRELGRMVFTSLVYFHMFSRSSNISQFLVTRSKYPRLVSYGGC